MSRLEHPKFNNRELHVVREPPSLEQTAGILWDGYLEPNEENIEAALEKELEGNLEGLRRAYVVNTRTREIEAEWVP